MVGWPSGLGEGLQNLLRWFDSNSDLKKREKKVLFISKRFFIFVKQNEKIISEDEVSSESDEDGDEDDQKYDDE